MFLSSDDDDSYSRKVHPGREEGLKLVLDSHTDKISSSSISDNFRGFHVVVDSKENYPFTSSNGLLIKTGQDNEVIISATRFEANDDIKSIDPVKRNCYFHDEHRLKMHKTYTQENCFFECKIEYMRDLLYQQNETGRRCVPWFYPVQDEYLYDICDPWQTEIFQEQLKEVPEEECDDCLPDCTTTKYTTSSSAAPFKKCDRTNLGISPLCNLSTNRNMIMNPPMWKQMIKNEYEKFNGDKSVPEFVEKQEGVLSNIRRYVQTEQETRNLVFRAKQEETPTYDAMEKDVSIVNFYFDEANIIQYTTFQRMTVIDFISSVSSF